MNSEITCVAQNHVAQGTGLDADILFNDLLLQVREQSELESVADSLGSNQDRVMKICCVLSVSLTAVEEAGQLLSIDFNWLLVL